MKLESEEKAKGNPAAVWVMTGWDSVVDVFSHYPTKAEQLIAIRRFFKSVDDCTNLLEFTELEAFEPQG